MTRTSTWEALVQHPDPCDHIVQLYTDDAFLARVVTRFVVAGFAEREAAVIIATPAHRALFGDSVPDAAAAKGRGQLVMLDAAECLSTFLIDGMPDRTAFRALLAWVLNRVGATGYARTRLYGEMVNLLWERAALESALALEELWNEELRQRRLPLLCAYRIDPLDRHGRHHALARITRAHSHLIPVDDYERFDRAVDRAYAEVFGSDGDSQTLRDLLVQTTRPTTSMPRAQAALFALRDLSAPIADAVLERARLYYSPDPA
jgi:MEDS: MEthanogen/methylotroph, DcmR Sensory domain